MPVVLLVSVTEVRKIGRGCDSRYHVRQDVRALPSQVFVSRTSRALMRVFWQMLQSRLLWPPLTTRRHPRLYASLSDSARSGAVTATTKLMERDRRQ